MSQGCPRAFQQRLQMSNPFASLHASVAQLDETLRTFRARGVEPSMEGKWGEIRFAYLATKDTLGVCIEVWEMPNNYTLPRAARIKEKWARNPTRFRVGGIAVVCFIFFVVYVLLNIYDPEY